MEPKVACARVVRVKGKVFDKEGNKARIERAIFIAGRAAVKVTALKKPDDGSFDYEVELAEERPLLFRFVGRTANAQGQGASKPLHWAMVSYLATRQDTVADASTDPDAPLEYTINLVMFDKEGPEDIEPILQQLLLYERLYYIERLRGEHPNSIRAQYGAFVKEIPSPDGLRRELFTPAKLAAQGMSPAVVAFALDTVKRKRREVLSLYGLNVPERMGCHCVASPTCARYQTCPRRHLCGRRR
jgi:hypothetical protein